MTSCFVSVPGPNSILSQERFKPFLNSVGLSQIMFTEMTAHPLTLSPECLSGGGGHAYHFILCALVLFARVSWRIF